MKRVICALLALALAALTLAGCDRRGDTPEELSSDADFAPEATAIGGLTQAVEEQGSLEATEEPLPAADSVTPEPEESQQAVVDEPAAPEDGEAEPGASAEGEAEVPAPFSSPTPQPNASISQYSEVQAAGLGFRFSYPANWVNIPGRSTVCYVQPLEDGTIYPARVAVTMKRLPHKADGMDKVRSELASYIRNLMTQYDSDTFSVDTNLDTETKFMGNHALSTTYLAYDGDQEIKGYTIITYFERYLFVYHFLCAYDDYASFEPAMRYMRDSVTPADNLT